MIETNEFEDRNAESGEEDPFSSEFGELHSDTDDPIDIDSNVKEQMIVAKENAKKDRAERLQMLKLRAI